MGVVRSEIPNLVDGRLVAAVSGEWLEKRRPADGTLLCRVARSRGEDVDRAVATAAAAQPAWAERTAVARGDVLRELALLLRSRREELAALVVEETGKPSELSLAEVDAAAEMGFFVAGEGRRLYGRTLTSSVPHRTVFTKRQPLGVAALITSFNTPLPNIAWKAFPALLCGNAAVAKPSEHTPASALVFAELALEAGVPPGVLNVVQGLGGEAGAALVEHERVALVSFTGSAATGRSINEAAGRRLAKVCLELGGKNALVVCDDADLETALRWALASAFSNAGQRCASASRIVVFEDVYEELRARLVAGARALPPEPVISEESLDRILAVLARAQEEGAVVLCGGERLPRPGSYLPPTVVERVSPAAELSCMELFGPVTVLYRVRDLEEAIAIVNDSPYGLTSAIHTASLHRALRFAEAVEAGVVIVNGGTHGSEPHVGFGGVKSSGTGWREAGVEALDVYSDLKVVNLIADPTLA
ncbi:MAG: aldehyde dehydrogenase family protein [Thermoleophilia bacterium]|nr:aldehyde dehydrogenase family protein [Thermoleophilia bacterium]